MGVFKIGGLRLFLDHVLVIHDCSLKWNQIGKCCIQKVDDTFADRYLLLANKVLYDWDDTPVSKHYENMGTFKPETVP